MGEGDDDAGLAVHELQRRAGHAEPDQALVDEPGRTEEQRPAKGTRDDGDEERRQGNKQKNPTPRRTHTVQDIGFGRADESGEQRHEKGDAEGAGEDLIEIAVAENVAVVGEIVDVLDALIEAKAVEGEKRRRDERNEQKHRIEQNRGRTQQIGHER